MTGTDLVLQYFINERSRLEREVHDLQDAIRYRHVDTVDCLELIIAKVRLSTFLEISAHVRALLNPIRKKKG